ncbi:N-acetylmuramic acid 6-phosphate etherase [Actibacterium sp. 188UL27-1]|uniref:N-acetylmuramic acid 6-phosphate etherase n=1 Tax=Actibacterium sp. 188UL27-1 TaxID=2786961 RepID=UPI00195E3279|nr:N-acetylmuramic acid 6-phosphate etherase [Actibacterium sp. 188UL27-1]MBM7066615.1 N-acetylmuramic acid 6-phosphate etherase [Actibacterium sp. 188UL27-1]
MLQPATEHRNPATACLDTLPPADGARHLFDGQVAALNAVEPVLPLLAEAGLAMAATIRSGGRLIYAGAGSSGLMAAADALELSGTFGIAPSQIAILMAGGLPVSVAMPGAPEDDIAAGQDAAGGIHATDCVIAVAASGSTPYTVAVAQTAAARGATVVAVANIPNAPLFQPARLSICLKTPAECVAGSTRMGAGTAQKTALNIMSTVMGIALGHVHDGLMVNVRADNEKLHHRAAQIVARIGGCAPGAAAPYLTAASGEVKVAILLAAGAPSASDAHALLQAADGHLREALAHLPRPCP